MPSITIGLSCAQYFTIYVTVCQKAVVLVDDNTTNESGKLCCETAVASTHLCCHQILLFQSPYTGTKRCRQVPFLISFLWTISDLFKHITIYNQPNKIQLFDSLTFPEIAMIVAGNTRHGSIPVICVSGFFLFPSC